jgi:hypothetical protein
MRLPLRFSFAVENMLQEQREHKKWTVDQGTNERRRCHERVADPEIGHLSRLDPLNSPSKLVHVVHQIGPG